MLPTPFIDAREGIQHQEHMMSGASRLATVAAVVLLASTALPTAPARSAAIVVSDASFLAGGASNFRDCAVGMSFSFQTHSTDGSFEVLDATSSPSGPRAAVEGGTSSSTSGAACAAVFYEERLIPIAGVPVPSIVPITVTASFAAHASENAFAEAVVTVLDRGDNISGILGMAACQDSDPLCTFVTPNALDLMVNPNAKFEIGVEAVGFFFPQDANLAASFDAFADPVVSLGDGIVPGTDINFRDAFTLAISPGVSQSLGAGPSPVPEPGTLSLLGAGLVPLALLRRRRRQISALLS